MRQNCIFKKCHIIFWNVVNKIRKGLVFFVEYILNETKSVESDIKK